MDAAAESGRAGGSDRRVWAVSLVTLSLLLAAGGVLIVRRRGGSPREVPGARPEPSGGAPALPDGPPELVEALTHGRQGETLFRAWNRAAAPDSPEALALHEGARVHLQRAVETLQALLDRPEYRGADGELDPRWAGYEEHLQRWAMLLVDLEKGSLLGVRSQGG